jgi:hypothetical protein
MRGPAHTKILLQLRYECGRVARWLANKSGPSREAPGERVARAIYTAYRGEQFFERPHQLCREGIDRILRHH